MSEMKVIVEIKRSAGTAFAMKEAYRMRVGHQQKFNCAGKGSVRWEG
jgi:hypothetical protein